MCGIHILGSETKWSTFSCNTLYINVAVAVNQQLKWYLMLLCHLCCTEMHSRCVCPSTPSIESKVIIGSCAFRQQVAQPTFIPQVTGTPNPNPGKLGPEKPHINMCNGLGVPESPYHYCGRCSFLFIFLHTEFIPFTASDHQGRIHFPVW